MLVHHITLVSFLVKIWATCENFWANGSPPPWQKIARTPMHQPIGSTFNTIQLYFTTLATHNKSWFPGGA